MIQAGIVGGAGFTAGELIRLLLRNRQATLKFVFSASHAGESIASVHQDLVGELGMPFSNQMEQEVDVLFFCTGHKKTAAFLKGNTLTNSVKIIDLSSDFRLKKDSLFQDKQFVYGLPEYQKENIQNANYIANPGCFATAIQLGLLPLAKNGLLVNDVHISAITGATGAGQSLTKTTHFSWRNDNVSVYKVLKHQHLHEIKETLGKVQQKDLPNIYFIPFRGNFARGIFATLIVRCDSTLETITQLYHDFYQEHPFTCISRSPIHLKQVVNTNKCLLHIDYQDGMLVICSAIDNLLKGASGQAVQNMNLMFGICEKEGLILKAPYF